MIEIGCKFSNLHVPRNPRLLPCQAVACQAYIHEYTDHFGFLSCQKCGSVH